MIEVLKAGPLTTVQDLGRPGFAHLGVPRAGALDGPALRLANRLVGNPPDAAGLEVTAGGCSLRLPAAGTVALTGAAASLAVGGRPAGFGLPVPVPAGAVVTVGRVVHGVRSYLAIGGGIAAPPVLGSRSTDTLSGLGPAPLRDGDRLPLGAPQDPSIVDFVPWRPPPRELALGITLGPRADWFTAEAVAMLLGTVYTVSPVSNRVGARLSGATLTRAEAAELPSEGIVLGAVQVPASGQPLIFLADHPTTGGYPVIGVVDDVTPLAQAAPGTTVTFHGPER
ncbi:biotin-dependent carboxyltransferase family protein [Phytohabitans houttuyneae]|uniref:Allophanate hydrolase n=1 Tax=Phytohabitans houttuyneae TaxID=1076126 RepID=A0A6V8KGE7_9ACTN|nr:biotin-dependent carboxyltransferase family protein [Phytohabitans houttuyneae]GFJ79785.1 allophanate hydrolase [Phytohabitans houttuyneae]